MNQLAVSLSGHDKGRLYAIVSETDAMVFLADGRSRKLDHPKKKNLKHIRKVLHLPADIVLALEAVSRDSDLVSVMRRYQTLEKEKHSMEQAGGEDSFPELKIEQNE